VSGGFSEHFLKKYFAYRERYVAYIRAEAPEREGLAVLSEILRLTFVTAGSAFCALLFWLLTVAAFDRGGSALVWFVCFGACALCASWFAFLALCGVIRALAERRNFMRHQAR
jgi:hypothetical protein